RADTCGRADQRSRDAAASDWSELGAADEYGTDPRPHRTIAGRGGWAGRGPPRRVVEDLAALNGERTFGADGGANRLAAAGTQASFGAIGCGQKAAGGDGRAAGAASLHQLREGEEGGAGGAGKCAREYSAEADAGYTARCLRAGSRSRGDERDADAGA